MKNPFTFTETLPLESPMLEAALFWIVCVVSVWLFSCLVFLLVTRLLRRKRMHRIAEKSQEQQDIVVSWKYVADGRKNGS